MYLEKKILGLLEKTTLFEEQVDLPGKKGVFGEQSRTPEFFRKFVVPGRNEQIFTKLAPMAASVSIRVFNLIRVLNFSPIKNLSFLICMEQESAKFSVFSVKASDFTGKTLDNTELRNCVPAFFLNTFCT